MTKIYLLCTLSAFDRANRKAKPSSAWKFKNMHLVLQPFIPPVRNIKVGLSNNLTLKKKRLELPQI